MKQLTMFSKWTILFTCALISACNSAYVETLSKCNTNDDNCIKDLISKVLKDISKSGVEELKVPPIDPMYVENLIIPIMGLLNVTLENGQLKGLKDCDIHSVHNDFEKGVSNIDVTCDVAFKGKLKVSDTNPFLLTLFGNEPIAIDGNIKVKLQKLHMKMNFFYHFIKKDDGDVYFKCHLDEFRYEYEIGNAKMSADKILLGGEDASQLIVGLFNRNWKVLIEAFGKGFFEVGMPIFKEILHLFFDNVPAKHYLIGDLMEYVKNV